MNSHERGMEFISYDVSSIPMNMEYTIEAVSCARIFPCSGRVKSRKAISGSMTINCALSTPVTSQP